MSTSRSDPLCTVSELSNFKGTYYFRTFPGICGVCGFVERVIGRSISLSPRHVRLSQRNGVIYSQKIRKVQRVTVVKNPTVSTHCGDYGLNSQRDTSVDLLRRLASPGMRLTAWVVALEIYRTDVREQVCPRFPPVFCWSPNTGIGLVASFHRL